MLNQNLDNLKNILLASNVGITILGIIFFLLFCVVFIVVRNKNRKKQKISLVSITPTPLESNVGQKKLKDFEDNLLKKDFKQRLQEGLSKSRTTIWGKLKILVSGKTINEETKDEIEALLYQADISVKMVNKILQEVEKHHNASEIYHSIKDIMLHILQELEVDKELEKSWSQHHQEKKSENTLQVIMIVGVNGVGKTTTVGKLAAGLSKNGLKVVVAAADTFRAAAKEQLKIWCDRAGAELITGHDNNQDPAAVCYQAVSKAQEVKADYCLLDTAGRLHNNEQLMEELKKIKRVIQKLVPSAPQEILIVLDAMTGQNALKQAQQFKSALEGLTGVILTKCDGSAKAGCALSIVEELRVPIRFIGVGETLEDLDIFKAEEFVDALLQE